MRRHISFIRYVFILVSVLVSLLTIGCSSEQARVAMNFPKPVPEVVDSPIPAPFPMPAYEDERIEDGILIKITTSKSTYQAGENVPVVVYVENQSSQAISYIYSGTIIFLEVCGTIIRTNGEKSGEPIENSVALLGELRSGQNISFDTFWDQNLFDYEGKEFTATPGHYTLVASFIGRSGIFVGTTIQIE